MSDVIDVFEVDENYPTTNALLVPGPNQSSYTIFIYNYSDWVLGNQSTLYSLAQSQVNTNGTWVGVFDPISQTYSPVTLPQLNIDETTAGPYTVVAFNGTGSSIILALQINPTAPTPPGASTVILPTITVTGNYDALSTDCVILVNVASPSTALIVLPTTAIPSGQFFEVKSINTGVVTIQGQTGNIDGHSSVAIPDEDVSLTFSYDGTNYWIT